MIYRAFLTAAVAAVISLASQNAHASFIRVFDPYYGSSNTPATGATASVEFSFSNVGGDVQLTLNIKNTTGSVSSLFGTTNSGATASKLMGIAFDLPSGVSLRSTNYVGGAYFPSLLSDVRFTPFHAAGNFDAAIANNSNFQGGNPSNALPQAQSTSVTLMLDTALTAAALELAWTQDATLRYAARFQSVVSSGATSDKLLGGPAPPPTINVTHAPEPASLTLCGLGLLSCVGAAVRRRKLHTTV